MNKAIGISWEELQNEIFTPEEIEASQRRIAPIVTKIRTRNIANEQVDYTAQTFMKLKLLTV